MVLRERYPQGKEQTLCDCVRAELIKDIEIKRSGDMHKPFPGGISALFSDLEKLSIISLTLCLIPMREVPNPECTDDKKLTIQADLGQQWKAWFPAGRYTCVI